MSYEAILDSTPETAEQCATNSGMADFGRWVDDLSGCEELKHLRHYGWSDDLDALHADLKDAIDIGGYESAVSIAKGLLAMLERRGDAKVIVISDGCV